MPGQGGLLQRELEQFFVIMEIVSVQEDVVAQLIVVLMLRSPGCCGQCGFERFFRVKQRKFVWYTGTVLDGAVGAVGTNIIKHQVIAREETRQLRAKENQNISLNDWERTPNADLSEGRLEHCSLRKRPESKTPRSVDDDSGTVHKSENKEVVQVCMSEQIARMRPCRRSGSRWLKWSSWLRSVECMSGSSLRVVFQFTSAPMVDDRNTC